MHTGWLSLKFVLYGYFETDDIVTLESRKYDPTDSKLETTWAFYRKNGKNLEFIDEVKFELHVYSLQELSALLRRAGWEPIAAYGNIAALQPMNPLTSLNLVARVK